MSFSFIQISDHHLFERDDVLLRGFNNAYSFRKVLRHIAEHNAPRADFMVTTGDIVHNGTDAEYGATFERLNLEPEAIDPPGPHRVSGEGLPQLPMYFLPGNHDPRPAFFRNLFPQAGPREWCNAAFTHKGIQFVCIDFGGVNKGVAYPEALSFLAGALEANMPTIVLSHHPVVRVGAKWLDEYVADDVGKFWDVVRGKNVLGVFTGHFHMTYEQVVENIPVYGLRATTFQFVLYPQPLFALLSPQYRVVTVDGATITIDTVEVEL